MYNQSMEMNYMNIQNELFKLKDKTYRDFHAKLMPTIDKELIIGIRTPVLKKFARHIKNTPEADEFLKNLPHKYYEENNLHAFLLEKEKDFDVAIYETENFLPYIDNWATCDGFMPKIFSKSHDLLLPKIKIWIKSDKPYTVRYAMLLLMKLYLDEHFEKEYLDMVASIKSEHYYVKMMQAWYFATALAKQYESAVKYIEGKKLDVWVHNKTIQKAVESYRIDKETKEYLKSLKVK